jgi:hypothetical protein
MVVDH